MFNFMKAKKTDAIERNRKACYDLVHSDAWPTIQSMFFDKISDIQSVMNVDNSAADKAFMDMKVRINLARELKDILDSIIGASNQHEFSQPTEDEKEYQVDLDR